jgi:L-iditol 2-dehydrogenase
MKALVKYEKGPGNMEIRDVREPRPEKGQIKIEVKATGICGTDLHIYHDDSVIAVNPPVIVGHEFSGLVAELGEGTVGWNIGDRVVSELGFEVCGRCYNCLAGFPNLCDKRKSIGYWYNGAFARYVIVPADGVHPLPDNIGFEEGALTEPLACVVHGALELTPFAAEDTVLISGPGPIGLMTLQVARAQGAITIVSGVSADQSRLRLARELGADHLVDAEREDAVERVLELTGGRGADVVFECSGNDRAVDAGFSAIRKRGRYTQLGLFGRPISINFERVISKELNVIGSFGQRRSAWQRALALMARRKVSLGPLVSNVLPLSEWKRAFELFEKKQGLKVVLKP